ncbi:MAG: hypothetical protein ABR525_05565 [Candidatus Limnocylindria bacterium]
MGVVMDEAMDRFASRLVRLGLPLGEGALIDAHARVLAYANDQSEIHDLALMAIAVESYRRPQLDLPLWV